MFWAGIGDLSGNGRGLSFFTVGFDFIFAPPIDPVNLYDLQAGMLLHSQDIKSLLHRTAVQNAGGM